jgi:hypothetical protein
MHVYSQIHKHTLTHNLYVFVLLFIFETGSHYVVQAVLELLGSSDSLISVF